MYQSILWDFDGMLFNSYPHMARAMQLAIQADGKYAAIQEIMPPLKQFVSIAMDAFGLSESARTVYYQKEEEFDLEPLILPYQGIESLLRELIALGARHFLYTHRNHTAFAYLERAGIRDCFTGAVTSEDNFPPKPAPDAILFLCERYGLEKDSAIMLGDREIDVLSGINAGIHSCLFDEFCFHPHTAAEHTVTSISELRQYLLEEGNAPRQLNHIEKGEKP